MPDKQEIFKRILGVLEYVFDYPEDDITLEAKVVQQPDSYTQEDLRVLGDELEDEFEIDIPDEDAERFVTVQDVVDYIAAALEEE